MAPFSFWIWKVGWWIWHIDDDCDSVNHYGSILISPATWWRISADAALRRMPLELFRGSFLVRHLGNLYLQHYSKVGIWCCNGYLYLATINREKTRCGQPLNSFRIGRSWTLLHSVVVFPSSASTNRGKMIRKEVLCTSLGASNASGDTKTYNLKPTIVNPIEESRWRKVEIDKGGNCWHCVDKLLHQIWFSVTGLLIEANYCKTLNKNEGEFSGLCLD